MWRNKVLQSRQQTKRVNFANNIVLGLVLKYYLKRIKNKEIHPHGRVINFCDMRHAYRHTGCSVDLGSIQFYSVSAF
jgi:hypothetical protein